MARFLPHMMHILFVTVNQKHDIQYILEYNCIKQEHIRCFPYKVYKHLLYCRFSFMNANGLSWVHNDLVLTRPNGYPIHTQNACFLNLYILSRWTYIVIQGVSKYDNL